LSKKKEVLQRRSSAYKEGFGKRDVLTNRVLYS
jgi:hypothetical protein